MTTMASQITSLTVVYSTVYSDADQRKHQSSASLAFVRGIHRDRWIPRTKGQLHGKCFHLMTSTWLNTILAIWVWLNNEHTKPTQCNAHYNGISSFCTNACFQTVAHIDPANRNRLTLQPCLTFQLNELVFGGLLPICVSGLNTLRWNCDHNKETFNL